MNRQQRRLARSQNTNATTSTLTSTAMRSAYPEGRPVGFRLLCVGLDQQGCPDHAGVVAILDHHQGLSLETLHGSLKREGWHLALFSVPGQIEVIGHDPLCPKCSLKLEARLGVKFS